MSNKRELLYHLKKVQNLTSAVPYKNQKSKKKSKKSGLKNKNKNQNAEDEINEPDLIFSHKSYRKDIDMDFFFSLFDREQEFKKHMGKIKEQIYFIRWCHSYELKILNRKRPKYYYNPNILSYVDQFPSTYQEPSIQLKNPPKISQLPLPVSSSETIANAVKRVSKAHRKSLREKEIQIEKEKKTMIQYEYPASQGKQNIYQVTNTNLDETQNYDEELLKFTSQLLSNRAKSFKKRQSNTSQSNLKYSNASKFQRAIPIIHNDDTSNLSSTESTNSKINNSKNYKPKSQTKNNLKVSAPFELHTKRRKKSKSPSIIDATTNSASSTSKTNSKLKLDTISSVDSSSEINSQKQKTNIKKDGFFDFDPFSIKIEKPSNTNTQSSMSSESSQQNQKYKLMQIDQSVISIKPEKLQLVNLSDQDLSLPPAVQKSSTKSYQFSNNIVSVPPSKTKIPQEKSQEPYQLQSTSVSLSASSSVTSATKSKNEDTSLSNKLLDQEASSSQIEINSEIDNILKHPSQNQNNIVSKTNNSLVDQKNKEDVSLKEPIIQLNDKLNKKNKSNLDEDSSDLDFDLSELKLPKSIKSNTNTTKKDNNLKKVENDVDQFNFLPESLLFDKGNKNDFSDLDLNLNSDSNNKNMKRMPIIDSNLEISSSTDDKDINSSNKTETQQFLDQKSSSISIKRESIFSKISDIINNESIIEEEEESDDQDQTEIKRVENGIMKNHSNLQKQINSEIESGDEIKFNSQDENSSKIQISFDEQMHFESKEKSKGAVNSNSISNDETEDEIKLEVNLQKDNNNKKNDNFNLKDILPLSILEEIMQNSSNSEKENMNNSDDLFTSDEEKIIQSYMSNDDEKDKKIAKGIYKEQGSQIDANDILTTNDKESESSSNPNTPPNTKNANNQKSSPLSLSSGYDDDDSSSESFIDKLKKIFPNVDLD